ncbi:CoA transferase [Aureimonas altamirensis]|uniref:CaiB/BaiF CoA transferase family protein n=1 Tax=Aureimonas altamirensis TaxID=370622 RepID=UPI001E4430CD|nr:CoA transferase [Aureimonas altamirensis]UHD46998.1 CoA transferase [Aureimonas altamirensis]
MEDTPRHGPLTGLKVIELGHFVAAPFCTRLLGDLGADIIKIEPPGGDPVRQWGQHKNGHSPWWSMHGRNKRCITLDLKKPEARDVVLRLAAGSDALVENFRAGQLDRFGLDAASLRAVRPNLVIARISGFGQTGPFRDKASFGVIGEAMGGLRYLTNHPPEKTDLPPSRVGISIGDSIAGLYAAFGLMAALWQRDAGRTRPQSLTLDVALTESVLSMMEGMLPDYGSFGTIREPQGARIKTAAPTSAYPTADGGWLLIAANSDPLFRRLATTIGRPELAADPCFVDNSARLAHVDTLDAIITDWTSARNATDAAAELDAADIPASLAYTAADIAEDPQYRARGMVRSVDDPLIGPTLHAGIVPHVPEAPGDIRWPGPAIGAHTEEVLAEAGFAAGEISGLRERKVV